MADFKAGKYQADGCYLVMIVGIICFTILLTAATCSRSKDSGEIIVNVVKEIKK